MIAVQKGKKNEKTKVRPAPGPRPAGSSLPANMPDESELSKMFEAFLV